MDQVPKEIQKIILHLCDDETRRLARLACKNWFNYIDYREFAIYLTKQSDWPQIVDRLSTYTKPISLHFHKNIIRNIKDINEHLLRLTSLTDLTFDDLAKESDDTAEWFKLTALPNLQSVKVVHYDYDMPFEATRSFKNLTRFQVSIADKSATAEIIQERIGQLPNLQSCSVSRVDDEVEVNLFERNYPKMTYLAIYLPDVTNKTAENWFEHLPNLEELQFSVRKHKGEDISLKSLTKLDTICFAGGQIHELNSTKLTFLELFQVKEQYIERVADKLINLKELVFDFHRYPNENSSDDEEDDSDDDGVDNASESDNDDNNNNENGANEEDKSNPDPDVDNEVEASPVPGTPNDHASDDDLISLGYDEVNQTRRYSYQWLTALTSLEYLNIDPMEDDGLAFVPSQLRKLQITVCKPLDFRHMSRFVSLKELYIGTANKNLQDLCVLSQLTGLECLQIELDKGNAQLGFALTVFSNLEWLKLKRCSVEISHLPNLQRLILTDLEGSQCTGFVGLTKLTRLELQHNWLAEATNANNNYTFVSALTTLKLLLLNARTSYNCSYFSTLTALDNLQMHRIDSVEDYCYLSTLTRLTELRVWNGVPSENILRLPTSLQRLDVDLSRRTQPNEGVENDAEYDGIDVKAITEQLIARLPNLYKYSFD